MSGPRKTSGLIKVSDEILGLGKIDLFPMRRLSKADIDARRAEANRIAAEELAEHAALLAVAEPFRRAVLELHRPQLREWSTHHVCLGCDAEGYEVDDTTFPCTTYLLARDWTEPTT